MRIHPTQWDESRGDIVTGYDNRLLTIKSFQNIPISVISEGLGHDNEQTTQIYLASIKFSAIDCANRQILKDL